MTIVLKLRNGSGVVREIVKRSKKIGAGSTFRQALDDLIEDSDSNSAYVMAKFSGDSKDDRCKNDFVDIYRCRFT